MEEQFRPGGKEYVLVNNADMLKIDDDYIQGLKEQALKRGFPRLTMCLHNDVREHMHEMIHVYQKYEYVRPHSHPWKTETKIILEGELLVIIYDVNGCVIDHFVMSREKGGIFTFRMAKGIIHTNIPLTNVVFQEAISGPFTGDNDSVFPKWAPPAEDKAAVKKYMDNVLELV